MALRTLTISSYTPLHQLFVFAAAGGTTSSISTRTRFPAHLGGSHLLQRLPREPRKKMRRLSLLVFGFLASLSGGAALGAGDGEKGRGEIWSLEAEQSGDSSTVPAFPVVEQGKEKCHLDLSDELFGGVKEACGDGKQLLDRSRCCPVLAAWLYAAHARTALKAISPPVSSSYLQPLLPDDSQTCVNSLQGSLKTRGINIF